MTSYENEVLSHGFSSSDPDISKKKATPSHPPLSPTYNARGSTHLDVRSSQGGSGTGVPPLSPFSSTNQSPHEGYSDRGPMMGAHDYASWNSSPYNNSVSTSGTRLGGAGGVRTPRFSDFGVSPRRSLAFQRGRMIGSGGFGVVFQAILSDGTLAAVKQLKVDSDNLKSIDREIHTMSSLPPNPNCVRYFGSRHTQQHYYIIMEFISGGSIQTLRQQIGKFRESVFQRYAYMTLLGLEHLHRHGIIHRDIKGGNVLLDERGCAKIVDFGCCKILNELHSTIGGGGTPLWMAPEVCRGDAADEKADVWSYGCLCLEMTNDSGLPWDFPPGMTLPGVAYAIACAQKPPAIPSDLTPLAQDFIACCLRLDPEERPTVEQLLDHPFFDQDYPDGDDDEDEDFLESVENSVKQSAVKRMYRNPQRVEVPKDELVPIGSKGSDPANGERLVTANAGFQLNLAGDEEDEEGGTVAPRPSTSAQSDRVKTAHTGFKLTLASDESESGEPLPPKTPSPTDDGQEEYTSIVYELLSNMKVDEGARRSSGLKTESSFSRVNRSGKDPFDVSKARHSLTVSDSDSDSDSDSGSDTDSDSSTSSGSDFRGDLGASEVVPPPSTSKTKTPAQRNSLSSPTPTTTTPAPKEPEPLPPRLSSTEVSKAPAVKEKKLPARSSSAANKSLAMENPLTPREKKEEHVDPTMLKEEELIWVSGAGGSVPKEALAQRDMDAILGVQHKPSPSAPKVVIHKKRQVDKDSSSNGKKTKGLIKK